MTQNSATKFNKKYNLIFDEQDKLPKKKGNINNSIVETKIIDLANDLIKEIIVFKANYTLKGNEDFQELDNIIDGCRKLTINVYDRFGGRGDR